LSALACIFPISKVFAYDINSQAQAQFILDMQNQYDFEFVGVSDAQQAVVDSDIVVTSGPILKKPKPTIQIDWLQPGGFASAVDYDSYWSSAALVQMDILATDDLTQFLYHRQIGYFDQMPDPNVELGDLVAGCRPGRQNPDQRALAVNLGLAMDDMAIAPEVYRRARDRGLGVWLTL
jgi:ornithine cyclodeaminase/alanine dehydrogenase